MSSDDLVAAAQAVVDSVIGAAFSGGRPVAEKVEFPPERFTLYVSADAMERLRAALAAKPEPGRRIFVPEGSRDSGEVDRITAKGQYPQEPAANPEPGLDAFMGEVTAILRDWQRPILGTTTAGGFAMAQEAQSTEAVVRINAAFRRLAARLTDEGAEG